MKTESLTYNLAATLLKVLLLAALIGAGWNIYRKMPVGGTEGTEAATETALVIVLRPSERESGAGLNIPVQLYPVDIAAVEREFGFERRPGVRFEDFLKERMDGRAPLKAQLDEHGEATVKVTPGRWWIHATLAGPQSVEWRLPIDLGGSQQTVELNGENVYARTKSF
ncbi:MAG TPA: hypothetical protein VKB86_13145 [Pyrinomonadaceae bacterium]|nr:hypothetical protein [Pyrinomonadaceae bacterium]